MSKKELKILNKQRDEMVMFYSYFIKICMEHVQGIMAAAQANDILERNIVNFTMMFNVHNVTAFMVPRIAKMQEAFSVKDENGAVLLKDWTEHFNKKVLPMYEKEVAKIRERAASKSESNVDYIQ